MPVERVFLGWDRPILESATAYLVETFARSEWELAVSNLVVVTPGSRASRNLLGRLIDVAAAKGLGCGSPVMLTPGRMPEMCLVQRAERPASDTARQLAWRTALATVDAEELEPLVPVRPEEGRSGAWDALAQTMQALHNELCGELMSFGEVPARASGFAAFTEDSRWQAASVVQSRYLEFLQKWGLHDPAWSAMQGLREGASVQSVGGIVLVGVAELSAAARRVVELSPELTRALVFAPETAAESFDALGCIRADRPVMRAAIGSGWIKIVDSALMQADAAFGAIAEAAAKEAVTPDDVVIGVPDEGVVPCLVRRAEQIGGVRVRSAAGQMAGGSAPVRLLRAMLELVKEQSDENVVAWAKHEGVDAWLCELNAVTTEWWIGVLEGDGRSQERKARALEAVRKGLELVACLKVGPRATVAEIVEAVFTDLRTVFGGLAATPTAPADRVIAQVCLKIRGVLAELMEMASGPAMGGWEFPETVADVLAHTIAAVEGVAIPDEPGPDAIELLGWLEVAFDPAGVLVLTGMNEGTVPSKSMSDPFLPDGLRKHLGVSCDQRRLARDAYLLCAATRCRRSVTLIASKRDADGGPLLPSRLLMAGTQTETVQRVRAFVEKGQPVARPALRMQPGKAEKFFEGAKTVELCVRSMAVGDFASYLASPYHFYLQRVLKLKEVGEGGDELDALAFGNLLHDALERFGSGDSKDAEKVGDIEAAMLLSLNESVADAVGSMDEASAAVMVQVEFARRRLRAAAAQQAKWRKMGWKIAHTEWEPASKEVQWRSAKGEMGIRGRIDRIDVNEREGGVAILDYKSGDTVKLPEGEHVTKHGWFNLQLPLYRYLAGELPEVARAVGDGKLGLGYFRLPRKLEEVGIVIADWSAEVLEGADEAAADVVEAVRRGEFAEIGEARESGGSIDRMCGVGFLGERAALAEDDEEEGQ